MAKLVAFQRRAAVPMALLAGAILVASGAFILRPQESPLAAKARAALPQVRGQLSVPGLKEPVEVFRDTWGIPHIYAKNTEDLFFTQGFVVAQDRMWQLEMWRRNSEGRLSEIAGPDYVTRDKFARLLTFRGDWNAEYRKYNAEGDKIFSSFARGVNAAIQQAIDQKKVPVEFQILGFQPEPVWTAKTVLTRMPGWTLTRNVSSEVRRALSIKAVGLEATEEISPTSPYKKVDVPEGLDLNDITPEILNITAQANNLRIQIKPDLGSNNWVIDGTKSTTGFPLLANDPHREVVNPALRYMVHLNAPGWNVFGATEPGLPGVSIGHNDQIAWGFTILGMDQQDLVVEETDPANPNRYLYKGQWYDMEVHREMIPVKGGQPVEYLAKYTRHGPVLYENAERHRAYALKWIGSEVGGAGYLGSLNVMQAKNWDEFNAGIAKSWYLPSHSLVYTDVKGNIGYRGVAYTPIRRNYDGLLPVPGKDGKYEWEGNIPFDQLPLSFNTSKHYYASANNDVVPHILPDYKTPLGYEYGGEDRYDRIAEVLDQNKKFTHRDMELLQQDAFSRRARELVPLLKGLQTDDVEVKAAMDKLLAWNYVLDRDSGPAAIFEFWVIKLLPKASQPKLTERMKANNSVYPWETVIEWMKAPDASFGATPAARNAARDQMLLSSLKEGLAALKTVAKGNADVKWGDIHTVDFVHPLAEINAETKAIFGVKPVRRGGSGYTVMNTSTPSERNTKQLSGASFMMVLDPQDWDRSTGLMTPGQSAQPLSPHFADLMQDYWGDGKYFPLYFTRAKVEQNATDKLTLEPVRATQQSNSAAAAR